MKQDAVQRKFDRLLVWKVSRLGRDMREVIATVNQLADLGVTVVPVKSQTGPISSPMRKLLWAIQVWFAEMENSERSEAIRAGQARARAAGKSIGRPKVVFRRDLVAELRRQGSSWRRIARELDADVGTVRRAYLLNCGSTAACQNCGDVVLDCGADVGVYTREALVQGARLVVAIEPSPLNLECLRRNLAAETAAGRVIIYEKGVWDKDDFLTITVVPGNPAADTFVMNPQGGQAGPKLPRTSIDKLVAELKLDRVDYIKMDIEGAEQRAIRGAAETLRRFHPRLALSSYHLAEDPEKIPELVRSAWSGYRMECGPCTWANGIVRPDVLYFR
jgi:FkbM family methyltransferase